MADRDMKVSVLVQLVDRLTAPLRGITRGITGMANSIGDLGRRIGLIGGALAALSFSGPIQAAAAWDAGLRDIAITAGKTGGAVEQMIAETSGRYQKLALDVGQRSSDLAKGAQLLVASGMDAGLIDKLMPTIGRVATAANATIEDTAKTAFALSDTLKVVPEQMEQALGKLVTAGKLGRFEFKNMASEFPALTNQMAKFGITGMEAVASLGAGLQIAMLGTANPSEAATNLKNFLTKINAPEAIKKFEKELKVDVTGVMTDAAAKGINPIEAVIQKMSEKLKVPTAEIDKIMKKAGASGMSDKDKEKTIRTQVEQLLQGTKVGKLYSDMQVLDFLIPTLLNLDKLKDFKSQVAAAGTEVINDDFASRMRGLSAQLSRFGELGDQALRRIGTAFASNLPVANTALNALLGWVGEIDGKWPGLIDKTLSWTGALLALGAGIAVLTPVVSALAGVLGLLLSPLVLLATPIGAAVAAFAALAAGATYLWMNWSTVGPQLSALWDSLAGAAGRLPGQLMAALASLGSDLSRLGVKAGQDFLDGISGRFDAIVEWARALPGRIIAAIGSIDLSSLIKMPSWMGGGAAGAPGGQSVDPMGNPTGFNPTSAPGGGIGGSAGFTRTAGGPAANGNMQVGGVIRIEAAEGTRIVNVESANPAVPIVPNRGTMLGRA